MTSPQETRVVSETGGAKGVKLARFDLIPWRIIQELAEHYGRGARKYEDRNWERGYKWSASFAALHRHLEAFWNRDDIDHDEALYIDGEEHVVRHIIAVVWHACCLAYFSRFGVGEDDRPGLYITDVLSEPTDTQLTATFLDSLEPNERKRVMAFIREARRQVDEPTHGRYNDR